MKIPVTVIRALCAAWIVLACLAPADAGAAPAASVVMDMRNGKVLYARSADRKLHPASLTKMMTLYVTFDAIKRGKLRLNQRVRVSRHAARQPASKLYLKAGQRVTVRSLIRATAIKSANDAAMVLAEAVGGSQRGFARMMTRTAKRLGMKNTRFLNPHGLTARGHYSSARDMAILGRHLFFDFPQYYNIFKRKSERAAGKRIWNTNRLLSSYAGADGIKTGYTRAAGYNLVASAHRGKKRIIAVHFGGRSSAQRNRKVARLLDIGFSRARNSVRTVRPAVVRKASTTTKRRGKRIVVRRSPIPRPKPGIRETRLAAIGNTLIGVAEAATVTHQPVRSAKRAAPRLADLPVPRPGEKRRVRQEVLPSGTSASPAAATTAPKPRKRPRRIAQARIRDWTAEVGPFSTRSRAESERVRIHNKPLVSRVAPRFRVSQSIGRVGKKVFSLRMGGLSEGNASAICGALLQRRYVCRVVPTNAPQ